MDKVATPISNIHSGLIGTDVLVNGWIKSTRISGGKKNNLAFVTLKDGSALNTLQVIFERNETNADIFEKATTGNGLSVSGKLVESPGKGQEYELVPLWHCLYDDKYADPEKNPITKSNPSLEYLRTIPHFRSRTDLFRSIMKIKSELMYATNIFFKSQGFHYVQLPCITDNECESGANPFTITTLDPLKSSNSYDSDFFRKHVYLTVSGQLHLEALVLGGLQKAWSTTTAFRAEPSTGPRHLAEFWMLELEFCFGELNANMRLNEEYIKYILKHILGECSNELSFLGEKFGNDLKNKLQRYVDNPFVIISHYDCVRRMLEDIELGKVLIEDSKNDTDIHADVYKFRELPSYNGDLSKDHERYISEVISNGVPTFVKNLPAEIKAFYMPKINPGDEVEYVSAYDLLFPTIGEVIGGSDREIDHEQLLSRIEEKEINKSSLEFYSDLRLYGSVPHTGCGIGLDRLMMVITGVTNIKDLVPFPRAYEHCYF